MSCRHDLALGTCKECYPKTGSIVPELPGESGDGPGAVPQAPFPRLNTRANYGGNPCRCNGRGWMSTRRRGVVGGWGREPCVCTDKGRKNWYGDSGTEGEEA
jgi:hypothetical protein